MSEGLRPPDTGLGEGQGSFDARGTSPVFGDAIGRRHLLLLGSLFVFLAALYLGMLALIPGAFAFPIDDAYIHQQFARNLAEHGEIAFNRGVPSSGDTAPGYVWLLAFFRLIVRDGVAAAIVLGIFATLALNAGVYGLMRAITGKPDWAFWSAALVSVVPPGVFAAFQGMESPVYGALVVWALWAYILPGRRPLAFLLLAIGVFLRPEFLLFGPLIALERLIAHWGGGRAAALAWLREVGLAAAIFAACAGAWSFYNHRLDGNFVPSTYRAKVLMASSGWKALPINVWREGRTAELPAAVGKRLLQATTMIGSALVYRAPLLALFLPWALWALWRSRREPAAPALILAALALLLTAPIRSMIDYNAVSLGFQQQRYFVHASACLVLVAVGGFHLRQTWKASRFEPRKLAVAALLLALPCFGSWLINVPVGVDNIHDMHVTLARWVAANTAPGELVAANDIGAMAYYSEREILDLCGLVEPALLDWVLGGRGSIEAYVAERRPLWVVIFPEWFPRLANDPRLRAVEAVELPNNQVAGSPLMVVFRADWQ